MGRPASPASRRAGAAHFVLVGRVSDSATTDGGYLTIPDFFKASVAEEGGRRLVYLEAANEALDYQDEVTLAKALGDSAPYFLRYGNLDLDHITQIGPKRGISDYPAYEIGRPVDVKLDGPRTMVKGEIYSGDTPVAANANIFWDSITKLRPAQRWYPSVGGKILDRDEGFDPKRRVARKVIKAVRWTNIGFSKTPVNPEVPTVTTIPFGVLAKCWDADGLDLMKALEAGYGTDAATLAGGAALRGQSLDRHLQSYWDFRDRAADDVRGRRVGLSPEGLSNHAREHYGLDAATAAEWTERFLADIRAGIKQRGKAK